MITPLKPGLRKGLQTSFENILEGSSILTGWICEGYTSGDRIPPLQKYLSRRHTIRKRKTNRHLPPSSIPPTTSLPRVTHCLIRGLREIPVGGEERERTGGSVWDTRRCKVARRECERDRKDLSYAFGKRDNIEVSRTHETSRSW